VLSACSTGFDSKLGLYEATSPVRSFLKAGAGRVVASRWDVDSRATTLLMGQFYAALLTAKSPAESLRAASNSIRSNPEFSHPYYWAGFGVFARD
jgi:CHAT domain-containing protein